MTPRYLITSDAAPRRGGAHVARDARHGPAVHSPGSDTVDRLGDEVFFWLKREGQWYHVYDVRIERGPARRVPYESRSATHRIFVVPVGQQWRYTFGPNDLRSITAAELARQRIASAYHSGKNQHGESPR